MHTQTHLDQRVEDLEDLFLDEDREDGGVGQQLADELLNPRQEDLHRGQQRFSLICFSVPKDTQAVYEFRVTQPTLLQQRHAAVVGSKCVLKRPLPKIYSSYFKSLSDGRCVFPAPPPPGVMLS